MSFPVVPVAVAAGAGILVRQTVATGKLPFQSDPNESMADAAARIGSQNATIAGVVVAVLAFFLVRWIAR